MVNRLRRWLSNVPLADPVELRQSIVFQVMLLSLIVVTLLGIGPAIFAPGSSTSRWLRVLSVIQSLLFTISALVVVRRGYFRLAVAVAIIGILSSLTVPLVITAPMHRGLILFSFSIPIALAGLLSGYRTVILTLGLGLLIILGTDLLAKHFWQQPGFALASIDLLTPTAFLFAFGLLGLFVDRFGSALRAAYRDTLAHEQELKHLSMSLEAQVAERTNALRDALADVQARADEQARLIAENEQQRFTIQGLSVPVIPISDTTLVMPLIGVLDSARLQLLLEQALHAIEHSAAHTLILDITGIPIVDSQVAQGLLAVVQTTRLLGAETMLVGIRPEVAQAIVSLGMSLQGIRTSSDVQSALNQRVLS